MSAKFVDEVAADAALGLENPAVGAGAPDGVGTAFAATELVSKTSAARLATASRLKRSSGYGLGRAWGRLRSRGRAGRARQVTASRLKEEGMRGKRTPVQRRAVTACAVRGCSVERSGRAHGYQG